MEGYSNEFRPVMVGGNVEYIAQRMVCRKYGWDDREVWRRDVLCGECSTITFIDGYPGVWGKVGTDPDRRIYDHLPAYSTERSEAFKLAQRAREDFARMVWKIAFSEVTDNE